MQSTIKALVFDVYGTLFDVHSIQQLANEMFPAKGSEISQTWRQKQIEYSFLRQLMGQYKPFSEVTEDALIYSLKTHNQSVKPEDIKRLMQQYLYLNLFTEVTEVLNTLRDKKQAVFSNGSTDMLHPLLENANIATHFDHIISVDTVKQYKPTPASYMHVLQELRLERQDILFMSSNGWDISGAKSFGFQTAWINRNALPVEELALQPNYVFDNLSPLVEILTDNK